MNCLNMGPKDAKLLYSYLLDSCISYPFITEDKIKIKYYLDEIIIRLQRCPDL
jgi:hypothetical protein